MPYINGNKQIIKRYKGTQVVYDTTIVDVADNCDGNTISFEFTGSSLSFYLDKSLISSKEITATTSPYSATLTELGFNRLYPASMFYDCTNLTKVTCLPNMISAVRAESMFGYCSALTSVDINDWVFKPSECGSMFSNCTSLTSVTTNSWDMSESTTISYMFSNCNKLATIKGIEKWDVSKATTMSYMFNNCYDLTSLNISKWNTSSCTNMSSIFYGCSGLTSIDLSGWDVSKVTTMTYMFNKCSSLETINLTGWGIPPSITTPTYYGHIFDNCTSLNKLILGEVSQATYDWWLARLTASNIQNNVTIEATIV